MGLGYKPCLGLGDCEMERYDIVYHYGDSQENETMLTRSFESVRDAERYADRLTGRIDGEDYGKGDYYFAVLHK